MPATPSRLTRRSRPVASRCTATSRSAAAWAASTRSGRPSRAPVSASAAIARPFQAATTLSSRSGCGRRSRRCNSLARNAFHRCAESGSARTSRLSRSVEAPRSNVPDGVTRVSSATYAASSSPSSSTQLTGRPDVGVALDAVRDAVRAAQPGVGVQ